MYLIGNVLPATTKRLSPSIATTCAAPYMTNFSFWSKCNLRPKYSARYETGFVYLDGSFRQHFVKRVQIQNCFWFIFSCIQSEYRKIRTRNSPYLDTFHAVQGITMGKCKTKSIQADVGMFPHSLAYSDIFSKYIHKRIQNPL